MQLESIIKDFVIKHLYFVEDGTLTEDTSFLESGVIDSMGVMELVEFVQSRFGIKVQPHEIVVAHFDSVRKLAQFVEHRLSAAGRPAGAGEATGAAAIPALVGR